MASSLQVVQLRQPVRRFSEPTEQLFADWLEAIGVEAEYETRHLPGVGNRGGGFTPDFYVLPASGWRAQFIELTTSRGRCFLKKRARIVRSSGLYPGLPITLVVAGPARFGESGIPLLYWDDIKDEPERFRWHLRQLASAAEAA